MWAFVAIVAALAANGANGDNYVGVPRPDPFIRTSPFLLGRGVLNYGDLRMLRGIARKLEAEECLKISVFGNSVACGHSLPDQTGQRWATQLVKELNTIYPCKLNGTYHTHALENHCIPAVATAYVVNAWAGRLDSLLNGTDLVLGDFSATDAMSVLVPHWSRDGIHADPQTGIKVATETLLSMILRTANRNDPGGTAERHWTGIAAIWLVTTASAWIDEKPVHWTGDPYEHTNDASYMYLPVLQHYGVPLLSTMEVLGPFPTPEAQFWFHNAFMAEYYVHPHATGHRLTADLIMHYLKVLMDSWRVQLPWEQPPPSMVYTPPARLLHINSGTLRMHLDANPFQLRLRTPGAADESWNFWLHMIGQRQGLDCAAGKCCPAWQGGEHPKPGYISTTVNSTCGWLLNATEVATHMKFNEFHVLALKSYEHMGVMGVSVYAVGAPECPESSTVLPGGPQLLGSATIDCLWQQRMSTAEDEYMKLVPAPAGACIRVNITVLPPPTPRPENKIKFLGFSLY